MFFNTAKKEMRLMKEYIRENKNNEAVKYGSSFVNDIWDSQSHEFIQADVVFLRAFKGSILGGYTNHLITSFNVESNISMVVTESVKISDHYEGTLKLIVPPTCMISNMSDRRDVNITVYTYDVKKSSAKEDFNVVEISKEDYLSILEELDV